MTPRQTDQVLGIVLLVLGILIALGYFGGVTALVVLVGAIVAVVLGILVLAGKRRGSQAYGIALVVIGAALILSPYGIKAVVPVLNLVAGVLLAVAGVLKLQGKW